MKIPKSVTFTTSVTLELTFYDVDFEGAFQTWEEFLEEIKDSNRLLEIVISNFTDLQGDYADDIFDQIANGKTDIKVEFDKEEYPY